VEAVGDSESRLIKSTFLSRGCIHSLFKVYAVVKPSKRFSRSILSTLMFRYLPFVTQKAQR
jgi:hypothetical protein